MPEPEEDEPKTPWGPSRMVAVLLSMATLAALLSCYLVSQRVEPVLLRLRYEGGELSAIERMYASVHSYAYIVPPVLWLIGMWLTRAGESRKWTGVIISALLLVLAVAWEIGSHVLL